MRELFLFFVFIACYFQSYGQHQLLITAHDLSEDGTKFSSHKDEVMIFVFKEHQEFSVLDTASVYDYILFRERGIRKSYDLPIDKGIVFLVELDDLSTKEMIEPVLRVYYKDLIRAYYSHDYVQIGKYLGDNDLLGYFQFNQSSSGYISGIQGLEKYRYFVEVN